MMKFIFYFSGIFFLFYEIYKLYNISSNRTAYLKYKREMARLKEQKKRTQVNWKWGEMSEATQHFTLRTLLIGLPYMLWAMAGLLTFNWVLFISLWALTGISHIALKTNIEIIIKSWLRVDALLSMSIIGFAIINAYHLHINLYEVVKSLF